MWKEANRHLASDTGKHHLSRHSPKLGSSQQACHQGQEALWWWLALVALVALAAVSAQVALEALVAVQGVAQVLLDSRHCQCNFWRDQCCRDHQCHRMDRFHNCLHHPIYSSSS